MNIISKKIKTLFFFCVLMFFVACGSVDSDAKKAAALTNKSIEQMSELKLKEAQKSYQEAQKIIAKYKEHKKEGDFNTRYREYRDKGKLSVHE